MSALQAFKSGKRPLYAVVGGYHLGGVGMEERIPATVEYFSNTLAQRPRFMVPMHCTGFNAKVALKNAMGDIIVPAGSGSRIFIPPIEERTTRCESNRATSLSSLPASIIRGQSQRSSQA